MSLPWSCMRCGNAVATLPLLILSEGKAGLINRYLLSYVCSSVVLETTAVAHTNNGTASKLLAFAAKRYVKSVWSTMLQMWYFLVDEHMSSQLLSERDMPSESGFYNLPRCFLSLTCFHSSFCCCVCFERSHGWHWSLSAFRQVYLIHSCALPNTTFSLRVHPSVIPNTIFWYTVHWSVSTVHPCFRNRIRMLPKFSPFLVGTTIATVKTALADLIVQMVVERKTWDQVDWRRNKAFLAFGFFYMGIIVSLV